MFCSCAHEVTDNAAATRDSDAQPVAVLQSNLLSAFDETSGDPQATVNVIVSYRDPMTGESGLAERRRRNELFQTQLLAAHADGFEVARRFMHVPAVAGRITRQALERLRMDPDVLYIQLDGTGQGALKESVPAIGGDVVHNMYGLTGKGVRVAVLDTGIVTKHPDLQDALVEQHCFTQFACPPAFGRESTSAEDDHGHGSNVAGIVGSRGKVAPLGFAPGAELVAVKINDRNDSGQVSDWVAGLDWIYDNLSTLKVKVVNMSICSTAMYPDAATCDAQEPAMARAVKNLVDAGVTLFAASGNLGSTDTLTSPACNTGVIAVAATYDSDVGAQPTGGGTYRARFGSAVADCADPTTAFDQITCFSNTPARVDVVAPGAPMLSDGLNNQTSTYRGTSQASPVGAGVAALMLECNPNLTPAQIKDAMVSTGVPQVDGKTKRMFPSLRAPAAVKAVCPALGAPAAAGSGALGSAGASAGAPALAGAAAPSAAGAAGAVGDEAVAGALATAAVGGVTVAPAASGVGTGTTSSALTGAAGVAGLGHALPSAAAGSTGSSGAGATGASVGFGASAEPAKDGCGCSSLGARRASVSPASWLLALAALGGGLLRRRARAH